MTDVFDGDSSNQRDKRDIIYVWSRSRDLHPPYAHTTLRIDVPTDVTGKVTEFMYRDSARKFHSTHEVYRTAFAEGFYRMSTNPDLIELSHAAQVIRQAQLMDQMAEMSEARERRYLAAENALYKAKTKQERQRTMQAIAEVMNAEQDPEAAEELRKLLSRHADKP